MRPDLKHPAVFLATWLGSGYLPKAPGTWGSLAALPFAWAIAEVWGAAGLMLGAAGVFVAGIFAAEKYMALSGENDPGPVVIDEVAGQWLTLAFVPFNPVWFGLGFLAFRLFDITKPWPIRTLERRFKNGFGVMIDDIAAGLFAAALLYVVHRFLPGGTP